LAVQQSLLYRQKLGRARKLNDRYAADVRPGKGQPPGDPLDWLLTAERRQMVRAALQTLPETDAEILLLKYTEGWSYHQIAAHLDLSHSAVEAKLHRARQKLRGALASMKVTEA
jgi:RNA polymerase sigma-70 factor (ECF subfamily)